MIRRILTLTNSRLCYRRGMLRVRRGLADPVDFSLALAVNADTVLDYEGEKIGG